MNNSNTFLKATTTESSALKSFGVFINGFEIKKSDITDIQLNFGENIKVGSITITDILGYSEITSINSSEILIQYTDFNEIEYAETFVTTEVNTSRDSKNTPIIDIQFEDSDTFIMKNTYINYHYKNVTAIKVLENIFNNLGIGIGTLDNQSAPVFETVVVPTNESLWKWIERFCSLHGLDIVRDKYTSYIAHSDEMLYKDLPFNVEGTYSFNDYETSYRRITEYDFKIVDRDKTNNCPAYIDVAFDYGDSVNSEKTVEFEDTYFGEELNSGTGLVDIKFVDSYFTVGHQQHGELLSNHSHNKYRNNLNSNQELKIFSAGLNKDRLHTKLNIVLPRPQNIKGNDETLSGLFVVTKVIDKISNDKYFQQITLQRSDYGKGVKIGT